LPTSSDIVISCEGVGKRYRIGERERYRTLREAVTRAAARAMRGHWRVDEAPAIWALEDITFQMRHGEVLGVIGRNGSGKSTLLKILSRITRPTRGRAWIRGRVGSLLEVGTGFHSELTGRENIFLNGAILGMRRTDILRRFDDIIDFADVGEFLDTPVKRYSSGMAMRLAFAVAAHLEPEILLVDEVLAVGDAVFQKKCLGKMGEASHDGRTALFVSHNMLAVQKLCHSAIWLDGGRIRDFGPAGEITHRYLRSVQSQHVERKWEDGDGSAGDGNVRLRSLLARRADHGVALVTIRTPLALDFEYSILKAGIHLALIASVYNEEGVMVFSTDARLTGLAEGTYKSTCQIPGDLLNAGMYSVSVTFARDDAFALFEVSDAIAFEVEDSTYGRGSWYDRWPGAVRPVLQWSTESMDEETESIDTLIYR